MILQHKHTRVHTHACTRADTHTHTHGLEEEPIPLITFTINTPRAGRQSRAAQVCRKLPVLLQEGNSTQTGRRRESDHLKEGWQCDLSAGCEGGAGGGGDFNRACG